jgi:hypothetical protein
MFCRKVAPGAGSILSRWKSLDGDGSVSPSQAGKQLVLVSWKPGNPRTDLRQRNVPKRDFNDEVRTHLVAEAQIKTAEAKLATLKVRAETTKANIELKAIAELLPKKQAIQQKLQELKVSGRDRLERAKADLEARDARSRALSISRDI